MFYHHASEQVIVRRKDQEKYYHFDVNTLGSGAPLEVERLDTSIKVLGRPCEAIKYKYKNAVMTYFYDPQIRMRPAEKLQTVRIGRMLLYAAEVHSPPLQITLGVDEADIPMDFDVPSVIIKAVNIRAGSSDETYQLPEGAVIGDRMNFNFMRF